ncbi:OmpA family protein [Paracraurococcus lichenis]|uniref:OmpA family protein n=1 Tax=Paracraurococcus lichenis TaxID=3064888 RepID=A0ABT9E1I7_9PROT|nr:OmpA family protein [Paracraurococcus sp. LOR1-02]MDO9710027.1 OmpA family protein [Paracraurococcus sp. LOR1-02]
MSLRRLLLAASLLAPFAAAAQPVEGLYLGAGAGLNFAPEASDHGVRLSTRDPGAAAVLSLGWGFGNGWRAEIEGNYRNNEIDRLSLNGTRIGGSGQYDKYGVMANLLFDFDLSSFGLSPRTYQPYLGIGGGYVWNDIRNARLRVGGSGYRIEDTDPQFAYQAILGSAFGLGNMVPGLSLTAEYRFLGTLDPKFNLTRTSGPAVPGVPGSIEPSNSNHSVLLGLRYAFNPPPAPAVAEAPAPVTAPAPARTYLVFFDWDRADLTERARQIIADAAAAARRVQTTRIEVAGHADRSGTPQYNQRLSQRRADAVANELVRQGIAREEIAVTAFGETKPLVPTADGVREPQNRRVEIILR